jgi:hypothetical protein
LSFGKRAEEFEMAGSQGKVYKFDPDEIISRIQGSPRP